MHKAPRSRFLLGAAVAVAAPAIFPSGLRAAEFEWKYGIDLSVNDPIVSRTLEAFSRIQTQSNGRIAIKAFPSSSLGSTDAMLTQLRSGASRLLGFTGTNLDAIVPVSGITSVAFAFKDAANACAAFDGTLGTLIRQQIVAAGIVPVGRVFSPGLIQLHVVPHAIHSADDLNGLKLRVPPSKNNIEVMKTLGAAPVALATNEVFTSLSTHLIDGVTTSITAVSSLGWSAAIKYISLTNHQWISLFTLVNKDRWQSLPPNLQSIVERNLDAAALAQRRDAPANEQQIIAKLQAGGIAVSSPDIASFKRKLKAAGYYGRLKDEFGAAAWTALAKYSDVA